MAGTPHNRTGWLVFAAVALAAVACDLVSKAWIFDRLGMPGTAAPIDLLPPFLRLQTNLNEGALFGMGQGWGAMFAGISVLAIAGILGMLARGTMRADRGLVVALGLITGGILGNLYDRLNRKREALDMFKKYLALTDGQQDPDPERGKVEGSAVKLKVELGEL